MSMVAAVVEWLLLGVVLLRAAFLVAAPGKYRAGRRPSGESARPDHVHRILGARHTPRG
ncbi:MAG: hypothetical protein ACRDP1_02250 [Nocardioidaceae bacterium]